jgi:hypothetical protein
MTHDSLQPITPAAERPRKRRVRVKLRALSQEYGKLYPPDGQKKDWWEELKNALGTRSSSFVTASLAQIQQAARLPSGPVSETAINAALAIIQAAAPRDEIEGALAVQLACTHCAAMAVLGRIGSAHSGHRMVSAYSAAAGKLLRACAMQVEALRRLRGGGAQHVRVEHVHINGDGRALIGNVVAQTREGE